SMAAPPGRMTYLGVEVQLVAAAEILFYLPPDAFTPPPKVRSAVVRIETRETPDVEVDDRERFLGLVQAGFAAPRKRLQNSLAIGLGVTAGAAGAILAEAAVDPSQRPAALMTADWKRIYFAYRRTSA
ncbi:MAG: rRNA adenine N-6-methyltransferase family protein, partial [Dongiaceae bacterium]